MKKTFNLISFSLTFILLIGSANLGAMDQSPATPEEKDGSKWLQYARSGRVLVSDSIDLGADFYATEGFYSINIKLDAGIQWIKCCKACYDKDSWCDTALQDKRC